MSTLIGNLLVALAVLVSIGVAFRRLAPRSFARCHWALLQSPAGRWIPARWRRVTSGAEGSCGNCGSATNLRRPFTDWKARLP
jgi:hypothetical protein